MTTIRFSVSGKNLQIEHEEKVYDISDKVPEYVWLLDTSDYQHDLIGNWKARVELCKITRDFISALDNDFPVDSIVF